MSQKWIQMFVLFDKEEQYLEMMQTLEKIPKKKLIKY